MTLLAKLAGVTLALVLAQALLRTLLPAPFCPDLVLVFALALGLHARGSRGLFASFSAGFCVDVLSGAPLGLFGLLRGTACATTRLFDQALYLRAPLPWALYVASYAVLDGLAMQGVLTLLAPHATAPWPDLVTRLPGVALTSALVSPVILGLGRWLDADRVRENAWRTLGPGGSRARP